MAQIDIPTRKLIFIAYNFPPAGGAGVQRSLKFVKYLPEFGWSPIIISVTPNAYPVLDHSLNCDIPAGIPIYRINGFDINGWRPQFERIRMGKLLTAINIALMIPDSALLWSYRARSFIYEIIEQHQPTLVYSSSGPASAHLLGMWIQRRFNLSWVADFRDPWSENRLIPFYPGYRIFNRYLEHRVLLRADRVVTVSKPLAQNLHRLTNNQIISPLVIENGYDEEDVVALPPAETDIFTITYTGTFTQLRRPDAFVQAIQEMINIGQISIDSIRIVIAGKDTAKYIPNEAPFQILGYLSHNELANLREQSNLLLLIQDDSPENVGAFSGKLFEYLGSNRPTLAITNKNNVAAQLIQRAVAGTVCSHHIEEIKAAILAYYRIWQKDDTDYKPNWSIIHQYTRRNLTSRLASEFNQLTKYGGNI